MYGTLLDKPGGNSEPGIVLVSKDTNGNGLPDDEWYELAGSEYNSPATIRNYEITYYRPTPADGDVKWKDNQGKEGYIYRNTYHTQVLIIRHGYRTKSHSGEAAWRTTPSTSRVRACPSIG